MSKTITMQIEKTATLIDGLRKNLQDVKVLGLDENFIDQMEVYEKELKLSDEELDKLRDDVHARVEATNEKLRLLKEETQKARLTIRNNFPQEKWLKYGLTDKR